MSFKTDNLIADVDPGVLNRLIDLASYVVKMDVAVFRRTHLVRRFYKLADFLGFSTLEVMLENLERDAEMAFEIGRFLPIGYCEFFRDLEAYEQIATHMAALPAVFPEDESIEIMSAGCGTGEEVYSLACTAYDLYAESNIYFRIEGVDISRVRLNRAAEGMYDTGKISLDVLQRMYGCFRLNKNRKKILVEEDVAQLITFSQADFMSEYYVQNRNQAFHLIACRYIVSALTPEAVAKAVRAFTAMLKPGGLIWLAVGEYVDKPVIYNLEQIDANIYRKTD